MYKIKKLTIKLKKCVGVKGVENRYVIPTEHLDAFNQVLIKVNCKILSYTNLPREADFLKKAADDILKSNWPEDLKISLLKDLVFFINKRTQKLTKK